MFGSTVLKAIKQTQIYQYTHTLVCRDLNYIRNKNIIIILRKSSVCNYSTNFRNDDGCREEKTMDGFKKWLDVYQFQGGKVPGTISEKNYEILLEKFNIHSRHAIKHLNFLFSSYVKHIKDNERNEIRKQLNVQIRTIRDENDSNHIRYGLWYNSMFGKLTRNAVKDYHDSKLVNSMMFGQSIVFDCAFDNKMFGRERSSYVTQIVQALSINRFHSDPFNVYMCNQNLKSPLLNDIENTFSTLYKSAGPNITDESYLDIFPNNKLIYLSPNAYNVMNHFDPNSIYIIGGIVDLNEKTQVTLAKSKREDIKALRLPLDRYRRFVGRKDLSLSVVLAILLELKLTGDFHEAFKYIPSRLLDQYDRRSSTCGTQLWNQSNILDRGIQGSKKRLNKLQNIYSVNKSIEVPTLLNDNHEKLTQVHHSTVKIKE